MAECDASSSSESFGTPGSPPPTPSDSIMSESTNQQEDNSRIPSSHNQKRSRSNTVSEKRAMRRERRKRRRKMKMIKRKKKSKNIKKQDIQQQSDPKSNALVRDMILYKQMARDYWDRWQWEMHRRKEEMSKKASKSINTSKSLHQIDPSQLSDPIQGGRPAEIFLGRGSFSIVRLKVYRGMHVAVKQFRTQALKLDVDNEALFLSSLCHPYLPYLFGVCSAAQPYRIVTQFHGINYMTVMLQREIHHRQLITDAIQWIILCSQLLEAVDYLHCEAQLLHNDIKEDNILLTQDSEQVCSPTTGRIHTSSSSYPPYHIVLTDFGKATHVTRGRQYNLSEQEKVQYLKQFPHFSPEVVYGNEKQTAMSDMYAVGVLFNKMLHHGCFESFTESDRSLFQLIEQCKSADIIQRLTAKQCIEIVKNIIEN